MTFAINAEEHDSKLFHLKHILLTFIKTLYLKKMFQPSGKRNNHLILYRNVADSIQLLHASKSYKFKTPRIILITLIEFNIIGKLQRKHHIL